VSLLLADFSIEVKRDIENQGEGDTPARDSLGYIQLEKQNERLKEALIK